MGIDRDRTPGRQARLATSRVRRTWYGYGKQARVEKGPVRCFLHDVTYVFGDVAIFGFPAILSVSMTDPSDAALVATALVTWVTMALVAAAIRTGWIPPLATGTPGWVSMTPLLVVVRVLYYNPAFALAVYGGLAIEAGLGVPYVGLGTAVLVGTAAILLFPAVAERAYVRAAR